MNTQIVNRLLTRYENFGFDMALRSAQNSTPKLPSSTRIKKVNGLLMSPRMALLMVFLLPLVPVEIPNYPIFRDRKSSKVKSTIRRILMEEMPKEKRSP